MVPRPFLYGSGPDSSCRGGACTSPIQKDQTTRGSFSILSFCTSISVIQPFPLAWKHSQDGYRPTIANVKTHNSTLLCPGLTMQAGLFLHSKNSLVTSTIFVGCLSCISVTKECYQIYIPYSRKYWRSIKFAGLAVGEAIFKSVKFKCNLRTYILFYVCACVHIVCMELPPNLNPSIFLFRLLGTKLPNLKITNISGYTVLDILEF